MRWDKQRRSCLAASFINEIVSKVWAQPEKIIISQQDNVERVEYRACASSSKFPNNPQDHRPRDLINRCVGDLCIVVAKSQPLATLSLVGLSLSRPSLPLRWQFNNNNAPMMINIHGIRTRSQAGRPSLMQGRGDIDFPRTLTRTSCQMCCYPLTSMSMGLGALRRTLIVILGEQAPMSNSRTDDEMLVRLTA